MLSSNGERTFMELMKKNGNNNRVWQKAGLPSPNGANY